MTIRKIIGGAQDLIKVENVLVSVYDKTGLELFIRELMDVNPSVRFLSTGGTYKYIDGFLKNSEKDHLMEVSNYTGFPEMEGGLVKSLHPKIHAGLLGERNNPHHQRYLREELNGGVFIDMAVVNLYPFGQVARKVESNEIDPATGSPYNFESARGNIDIGGPAMIRAGAKNFLGCAVVCDPHIYDIIQNHLRENNGSTSLDMRLGLALKTFEVTAAYDASVVDYLRRSVGSDHGEIKKLYLGGEDVEGN